MDYSSSLIKGQETSIVFFFVCVHTMKYYRATVEADLDELASKLLSLPIPTFSGAETLHKKNRRNMDEQMFWQVLIKHKKQVLFFKRKVF